MNGARVLFAQCCAAGALVSVLGVSLGSSIGTAVAGPPRIPVPASDTADIERLPGEPADPDPTQYGYDTRTGVFRHPAAAPASERPHPFAQSLDYLDQSTYSKNTKVEAYYPFLVATGHTWQATFDMNGRRYMYHYYRSGYKVYDITNVRAAKIIAEKKVNFSKGEHPFGPFVARWNKRLGKLIAIQCYETPRFGVLENKYLQPDKVREIRSMEFLRGFKIFELTSPTEWKLLSETTLDPFHSAANVRSRDRAASTCRPISAGVISSSPARRTIPSPCRSIRATLLRCAHRLRRVRSVKSKETSTGGCRASALARKRITVAIPAPATRHPGWVRACRCSSRARRRRRQIRLRPMGGLGSTSSIFPTLLTCAPWAFADAAVGCRQRRRQHRHLQVMRRAGLLQRISDEQRLLRALQGDLCDRCARPQGAAHRQHDAPASSAEVRSLHRLLPASRQLRSRSALAITPASRRPAPGLPPYAFYNAGLQIFDVADPPNRRSQPTSCPKWWIRRSTSTSVTPCMASISNGIATSSGS